MIAVCTKQLIQDFFRVRLKVKFAVSPWLVGSVPLYVCAHQLSAKASSLWHGQYRQGASRRVCVCVSEVYRVLGVTVDRLEYLQVTYPLILLGRLFDGVCEAINRIYVLFMPSKDSVWDMGLFGTVLPIWESQVFIFMLSHSVTGEIIGKKVSLGTEMYCFGKEIILVMCIYLS